jgi:hypothetical protein
MTAPCLALDPTLDTGGAPRVAIPLRNAQSSEAVITRLAIRLWTILGSWPDDVNLGIDHLALSGPNVQAVVVEAAVRRQAAAVDGVLSIKTLAIEWQGVDRSIAITVAVASPEGPVLATLGPLGTYAGFVPGAWYVIGRVQPISPRP